MTNLPSQIIDAGWKLKKTEAGLFVATEYEDDIGLIPIRHPSLIHLEIYRKHTDPGVRYQHLKSAHHMFWPSSIWHEWTARRFQTHCESHNYITLAAGASASKSYDEADYAILFWYANPSQRGVVIASVTISSLLTRVWGYLTAHIRKMAVKLPYKYMKAKPPFILLEEPPAGKNKIDEDTIHGIFAVAAKAGDDDQAVATWIGKHPDDKLLVILDECTDMPMSILNALPNLNSHPKKFELVGIGNSNSTQDLHGLLSTPKAGWDSVSPDLISWETTQPSGICLYFNPEESPAITDPDPARRAILEEFLMGAENLANKKKELGTDSEKYYRWVLGFWKSRDTDSTKFSEKFLKDEDFNPKQRIEFSGYYPVQRVASLDPAFSTEGDKCLFRILTAGHCFDKKVRIDLGAGLLTFEIKYKPSDPRSIERQIGEECFRLLKLYNISIDLFGVDVTGQGRAIAEVVVLINEKNEYPLGRGAPLKIYSMSPHNMHKRKKAVPDIIPMNSNILWDTIREYMEHGQIGGLDDQVAFQLTNRLIVSSVINGKRVDRLESKKEYKRRMSAIGKAHSPDEADSAAIGLQVIRQRLGIEPGTSWEIPERTQEMIHQEKMALQFKQEAALTGNEPTNLDSDFSSSLEDYVNYGRPF